MKVVFSVARRNRFWFGMMISVSTTFCSASMPSSAWRIRLRALELERLGDDADGQHAELARGLGDDRRGAGAGAAAHAGGDEAHVRAGQVIDDLLDRLLGGGGADRGPRAGAQTLGDLDAHLDLGVGLGSACSAWASVLATTNSHALELLVDHVVDRVAAGAADAEHGDPGA